MATTTPFPLRRSDEEVARLFASLAADWRRATGFQSNLERIVLNAAYQRIIGLGPQALPCILADLASAPDHWFWALAAITGQDAAKGIETVDGAARAWLAWGREAGLI